MRYIVWTKRAERRRFPGGRFDDGLIWSSYRRCQADRFVRLCVLFGVQFHANFDVQGKLL